MSAFRDQELEQLAGLAQSHRLCGVRDLVVVHRRRPRDAVFLLTTRDRPGH